MQPALKISEAPRRARCAPAARSGLVIRSAAAPPPEMAKMIDRIAQSATIAFRCHPHLNNVLTHIFGADWLRLEATLRAVLDPAAHPRTLSPLALNLLDLMCAERGVTGRILKPYFHELLGMLLPPAAAAETVARVGALFQRVQNRGRI